VRGLIVSVCAHDIDAESRMRIAPRHLRYRAFDGDAA
jgi:hypothetical protein